MSSYSSVYFVIFLQYIFSKNPQISNLMNIRPVGKDLCHEGRRTDGRTDGRKKLKSVFRNFANALNKSQLRVQFLFVC